MSSSIVPSLSLRLWLPPFAVIVAVAAIGCAPPAPDRDEARASTSSAIDVPLPPDADQDGVPDAQDCDPQSSTLGARIVDDDLAEAKGLIQAAPEFSESAWQHADGAFEERSVRDRADAALFTATTQGDVYAKVTLSITDVDDGGEDVDDGDEDVTISDCCGPTDDGDCCGSGDGGTADDPTRQAFLLVGATDEGGDFYAYGCGIELVDGVAKASIVKLGGSPAAVTTDRLAHTERDLVEQNEDVQIEMKTSAGVLTCTVTQASSASTLTAKGIGTLAGSVGILTRNAAVAFKDAKVCQVNDSASQGSGPAKE